MPILLDPEQNETRTLFKIYNGFSGKRVLEIGSGDGRLTWRYAAQAAHVTAIDPDNDRLERAIESRPVGFDHVRFMNADIDSFVVRANEKFDLAILSWSL